MNNQYTDRLVLENTLVDVFVEEACLYIGLRDGDDGFLLCLSQNDIDRFFNLLVEAKKYYDTQITS